jgi:lipid II:glycine glycyltransferase (peptidoglycan interpeptide bridge formation enzyme)
MVRKALRNGIEVHVASSRKEFDVFYDLLYESFKNYRTPLFRREHMKVLRNVLVGNDKAKLFLARYKGDIVAGAFIIHDRNIGIYAENSSSDAGEKLGANDLIQWEVIKYFKDLGLQKYVLHGITLDRNGRPATGVSHFKSKFGKNLIMVGTYVKVNAPLSGFILKLLKTMY